MSNPFQKRQQASPGARGIRCLSRRLAALGIALATIVAGAAQAATTTPSSLAFGGQSMGTTSPPLPVTFTNDGGSSITVSSVTVNNAQFSPSHNCTTLAAGASCTINITFTPAAAAGPLLSTTNVTGSLSITSTAAGSPNLVSLAGTGEKSLVTHYYRSILRRAPDAGGKAFWESEATRLAGLGANVNETWFAMATFFYFSAEYTAFNRNNTEFVTDLYNTFFNRGPDAGGLSFWTGQIAAGVPREIILVSFMFSTEFQTFAQGIFGNTAVRKEIDTVVDFYRGILSRLPDTNGYNFWVGQFRTGQCQGTFAVNTQVESISNDFMNGAEYAGRNRTNAQFVGDLYNSFLRRGGDQAGVLFWIGQLNAGATRNSIRQQFIATPEFQGRVSALIAEGCFSGGPYPWPTWTGQIITVPPTSVPGSKTYYVAKTGSDSNNGVSLGTAFRTIGKAVSLLQAGDTVLIRAGLYREPINLNNMPGNGTAAKPVTIGSYGDGEVIVDGSPLVTGWVNVSGTVWRANINFKPMAVVVNELPLKQVRQGQGGSTAPQQGVGGVTNGSNKWHTSSLAKNTTVRQLTADFSSLAGGDPNLADIIVPLDDGAQEHVFYFQKNYITFKGLTVRGSGSNGIWGYGNNITVDSCNVKFNVKAAVSYLRDSGGSGNADNAVINSHIYHNVLWNWPRGNNGFAESSGGWPGTVVWDTGLRALARGNIVHMNGGEGIISYGTANGAPSGSALFEQNVAWDNWSVNMYFDNQPNNVARQNFLFRHPPDQSTYLYVGTGVYSELDKFTTCLMLADEQISGDSGTSFAALANSQVYNNLLVGCRIGIRDYSEGSTSNANHGLKNTIISNNTIVMPFHTLQNTDTFGIYLQDNGTRNVNTVIQNNIVIGYNQDKIVFSERAGAQPGLNFNNNVYFSTATQPFGNGFNTVTYYNFTGWKNNTGVDSASKYQDPLLVDVTEFRGATAATQYDFTKARLQGTSPALNAGTPQTFTPAVNFSGTVRSGWNAGAF